MKPVKLISGDSQRVCPYNKSHIILAKSFLSHLVKCRQNHKDVPTAVCRFDKTHIIPRPEKAFHESECPSQYLLDRERQRRAGEQGLMGDVQGPPIIADHSSAAHEEDWTSGPPVVTPALYNDRGPEEDSYHPFWGRHEPDISQNLPHTSSIAASVALPSSKSKAFPSSVFEFTTGYGRGRGRSPSVKSLSSNASVKQPPTSPSAVPVQDQFTDSDKQSHQSHKNKKMSSPCNAAPAFSSKTEDKSIPTEILFVREKLCCEDLHKLNVQHAEESRMLMESHQQELHFLKLKQEAEQRQMQEKQAQSIKLLHERLNNLRQLISSRSITSAVPASMSTPPPGFNQTSVSQLECKLADMEFFQNTNNVGEQKENIGPEEESWHEERSSEAGTGTNRTNGSDESKLKRNLVKKLRQIQVLEEKVSLGHSLSKAEEEKMRQKSAILSKLSNLG